ncbi:hypothetical protein A3A79_04950 [Candidatus Gottesmanbacteria bacterium RIFCSPLOWO2_01_FULL_43_11b]|uniref:Glycosyltransferase RgtA/B/C/D-like domain-containing protein n=1 Tax=Candidatus Gottesmanbacteria bacterium RIFCSPLOWO2_01_FULL_43_11b TaxID=1798392 RepID=A0A1F6AJB3_9BACT|nr:MAG: hypothetical protein A3A79_04950 [Candidatus Gottesmanbacteria bacterium RIFCSPLOWO2_01_FULL_43_11b]
MKKFFPDVILVILLIVLTLYAWRLLPQTILRTDAFLFMFENIQKQYWSQQYALTAIQVGKALLAPILAKLFGPTISLYLWFELGVILLIDVLFYLLVRTVTRSRILAFSASLIASVNYFGTWDTYGTHCYCFFLERVINVPFMIISFLFLHLFLTTGKNIQYGLSLILYVVGIGLGHVELLLTPAFALYPFWWFVFKSNNRNLRRGIFIGASFLLLSTAIVAAQQLSYGGWGPKWTLPEFLLNPQKYNYVRAMALQLVFWSDYAPLVSYFSTSAAFVRFSAQLAIKSLPYVFLLYPIVFLILFTRLPKFRALLVTCLTAVTIIFFLNAYVKLPEIIIADSNRYLYFPTFFLSIFWAIALWYFFLQHKGLRLYLGIILLVIYYFASVTLLENIMRRTFVWNRPTKALYSYIVEKRNSLSPNTLVVVKSPEFAGQEGSFFTQVIGRNEVTYTTDSTVYHDWKEQVPKYDHVIRLRFDKACSCVIETRIK